LTKSANPPLPLINHPPSEDNLERGYPRSGALVLVGRQPPAFVVKQCI
jgi:hypothetical protein